MNIGILIESVNQVDNAKKYIEALESENYNVCIFSDLLLVVDNACFSTAELLFFDGSIIAFSNNSLNKQKHINTIGKIVWISSCDSFDKHNDVIHLMEAQKDERYKIVFNEEEKLVDIKEVRRRSGIDPITINNKEELHSVLSE